jgi:hypothetical protein
MNQITTISNEANQIVSAVLDDGTAAVINLVYLGAIQRWEMSVTWQDFQVQSQIVTVGPNLLRAYRQTIPFGIACLAVDGVDPVDIEDFASGRCQLVVMNADEVQRVEDEILGAST